MMTRTITRGLALLAAATIAAAAQAASPPPSAFAKDVIENLDQRAAAEEGLRQWVDNFSLSGAPVDANFVVDVTSLAELKTVRLGQGFALEVLDAAALLEGASASSALRESGQWRYFVLQDTRAVGLVDVRKTGKHFEIAAVGAKDLAAKLATALAAYPGRQARFVRSYELTVDFVRLDDVRAKRGGSTGTIAYVPVYPDRSVDASVGVRKADAAAAAMSPLDEGAFSANLRALIARTVR
jgi:hypothetical protein